MQIYTTFAINYTANVNELFEMFRVYKKPNQKWRQSHHWMECVLWLVFNGNSDGCNKKIIDKVLTAYIISNQTPVAMSEYAK